MIKQLTTGFALMASVAAFSQVGIETETPQATLDVVGKPTNASVLDGIIAPRLEGSQLRAKTYTSSQTGALVYVTMADPYPAGQTQDVTAEGYYYFNGTKWVMAGAGDMVNIYNADGSITNERTLTLNGNDLNFRGTNEETSWSADGSINQSNLQSSGGNASMSFYGGDDSNLFIQAFRSGSAQILATGNMSNLLLGTGYNTNPTHIRFDTSPGGNLAPEPRMFINSIGNVKIGQNTSATEKLDVDGITRLRNLPLNGTTNAHHTINGDNSSATQDQTFTATRTLVADANGVLGYVTGLPAASLNIYNANGALTSNRTLTTGTSTLEFNVNSLQRTFWSPTTGSLNQMALPGSPTKHASMSLTALDNNGNSIVSSLHFQIYPEQPAQIIATNDATALSLSTNSNTNSAPITFSTSAGSSALATEKMRITGEGRVGIGTSNPTEKLHLNGGNVRLQGLPLSGTVNAINTLPGGGASSSQDQTSTATRTVVADANGVLGYVVGTPAEPGVPKIIVSAGVPGTQNITNGTEVVGNFSNEHIDTYSAWTGNVFTVPTGMSGLYTINMQNSNMHTVSTQDGWFTKAFLEKSTNGGVTYTMLIADTNSGLFRSDIDNGNSLFWAGPLNAGDKVRVKYVCSSVTNNIITLGGITITRHNQ